MYNMTKYTCDDCDKKFTKKHNYEIHINRKIKCTDRLYDNECIYCQKSFANKSCVTRHIKNNCSTYKKPENNEKEIYDNKLKELLEQNKILKYEINTLHDKYVKLKTHKINHTPLHSKLDEVDITPEAKQDICKILSVYDISLKKQNVPATLKRAVWHTHMGDCVGKAKCVCCQITDITQLSFHCGHIVSEKNGGSIDLTNLRPICQNCNSSMGSRNMDEFIETLQLHAL
jgi:hypothetical protein